MKSGKCSSTVTLFWLRGKSLFILQPPGLKYLDSKTSLQWFQLPIQVVENKVMYLKHKTTKSLSSSLHKTAEPPIQSPHLKKTMLFA